MLKRFVVENALRPRNAQRRARVCVFKRLRWASAGT